MDDRDVALSGPSVIAGYLCSLCLNDEGKCTCTQPCGSVLCHQFPETCGTYPNGVRYHCWPPQPHLTREQIERWRVIQPDCPCVCGEKRTLYR